MCIISSRKMFHVWKKIYDGLDPPFWYAPRDTLVCIKAEIFMKQLKFSWNSLIHCLDHHNTHPIEPVPWFFVNKQKLHWKPYAITWHHTVRKYHAKIVGEIHFKIVDTCVIPRSSFVQNKFDIFVRCHISTSSCVGWRSITNHVTFIHNGLYINLCDRWSTTLIYPNRDLNCSNFASCWANTLIVLWW